METKIEIKLKERFRMTIPEKLRNHLGLKEDDSLWYEIDKDGKVRLGKIAVNKRIID